MQHTQHMQHMVAQLDHNSSRPRDLSPPDGRKTWPEAIETVARLKRSKTENNNASKRRCWPDAPSEFRRVESFASIELRARHRGHDAKRLCRQGASLQCIWA